MQGGEQWARPITTDGAPQAIGPYSQAIEAGGFVFVSGQVGIDPASGQLPEGIEARTEQALKNLAAIIAAAGLSMVDVVRTTVFYTDAASFGAINEIYARYMPDPPPARSAPVVNTFPRGILVSIDAIALRA
jgi:2-iminobutanoate/2-iminopropanoate deaminase